MTNGVRVEVGFKAACRGSSSCREAEAAQTLWMHFLRMTIWMHRNVLSQTSHLLPGCACCFSDYLLDVQEFQVLLGRSEDVPLTCRLKLS